MKTIKNAAYDSENRALSFSLVERVDSNNSQIFQSEFEELDNLYDADRIILDATDTTYISSAGLRVLLFIKERHEDITIKEIGDELYTVIDNTGFNRLMHCEKKLKEYSIEGMELIGNGASAKVYKMDADTIIKVFGDDLGIDEIKREMKISKEAFLAGIATAIPYEIAKVGDHFATIYEMVKADTLSKIMHENPGQVDMWSKKFGIFMKQMHQVEMDVTVFPNVKDKYNKYKETITPFLDAETARIFTELIDNIPEGTTFTHGDCHPNNIMIQNGNLILIDMGEAAYGSPIVDLMSYGQSRIFADIGPDEAMLAIMSMSNKDVIQSWETYVKSYFNCDGEKYEKINNTLLLYAYVRALVLAVKIKKLAVFKAPLSDRLKQVYKAADKDLSFF